MAHSYNIPSLKLTGTKSSLVRRKCSPNYGHRQNWDKKNKFQFLKADPPTLQRTVRYTSPLLTRLELLGYDADQAVLLQVAGTRRARGDPGHTPMGPQHPARTLPPQAAHAADADAQGLRAFPSCAARPPPTPPTGPFAQ